MSLLTKPHYYQCFVQGRKASTFNKMTEKIRPVDESKRIVLPPTPEGMSKKQWKKEWKRQQWDLNKEEYRLKRKAKRQRLKQNRKDIIASYAERGEELPAEYVREPRVNTKQVDSGMKLIIDCSFDDLMNDKEVTSLSNQITRAYAANRRANKYSEIEVIGFDKRLKHRFENGLSDCNHEQWNHFKFIEENEETLAKLDREHTVYLTADTEDELETLEPNMTYIIGGIVDKNRHKELCLNKAKSLGIPTKRLPIGKYIKLDGRHVLTTSHVVQLMLLYMDNRDWAKSMEDVLPQRKIDVVATLNQKELEKAGPETDDNDSDSE